MENFKTYRLNEINRLMMEYEALELENHGEITERMGQILDILGL